VAQEGEGALWLMPPGMASSQPRRGWKVGAQGQGQGLHVCDVSTCLPCPALPCPPPLLLPQSERKKCIDPQCDGLVTFIEGPNKYSILNIEAEAKVGLTGGGSCGWGTVGLLSGNRGEACLGARGHRGDWLLVTLPACRRSWVTRSGQVTATHAHAHFVLLLSPCPPAEGAGRQGGGRRRRSRSGGH